MNLILACVFSIFSTAVMSYISMATPIGPWIAPTLVLLGLLVYSFIPNVKVKSDSLVYVTIAGSIGGILATAFGFTLPTLYFLNQSLFNYWMESPGYFALQVTLLAFASGWYGLWIANLTEATFIDKLDLAFPVGQMVHKMIVVQKSIKRAWELALGFMGTTLFCLLQDGACFVRAIVPKSLFVCSSFSYYCFTMPIVRFDLWPLLWAIGFVTGHLIVLPLAMGAVSKIIVVRPLQVMFFSSITSVEFLLAFCSGMVLSGVLSSLTIKKVKSFVRKASSFSLQKHKQEMFLPQRLLLIEGGVLLLFIVSVLFWFGFSFVSQVYLILFTFVCTYQMSMIAGKIGLAQLGRFATFVLVPALFLFNLDVVCITVISTFVEATAGVAVDALFGRKVVRLGKVDRRKAKMYQYLGLFVSCLCIGVVFWLLINQFGLGSQELFAQRAQARQLLIDVKAFNYCVVLLGICFGFILKKINMSPMLVLGGLLMPLHITLGLVAGGLISMFSKEAERWYPFWSGVFAANSIWMLLQAIFNMHI